MSPKKIGFFIIIITSLVVINNLAHSTYKLWQKKQLVDDSRLEVQRQKDKNQELRNKLNKIERPNFIEEEARNKLFMVKPGEQVIVLSDKDLKASESSKPKPKDTRPNWKKWLDLFY
ncbi:MAG TPA: septum formation initiator family protein [Candidatus Limnocylindrales bacterium]|nr:septum formation initiator family protein [Candidatus Limnocylindrales bacterium]